MKFKDPTIFSVLFLLCSIVVALPARSYAYSFETNMLLGGGIFGAGIAVGGLINGAAGSNPADAMCAPFIVKCKCGWAPNSSGTCIQATMKQNMNGCPCGQATNGGGTVSGICAALKQCKGVTATGTNGGSMNIGDLGKLMTGVGSLMSGMAALKMADSMAQQAQQNMVPATPPTSATPGCSSYYPTSVPSSTDPCAYYVASSSTGIDTSVFDTPQASDTITSHSTTVSTNYVPVVNATTATITGIKTPASSATGTTTSYLNIPIPAVPKNTLPKPGLSGYLKQANGGVTVVVNNQTPEKNTEVAGFYGTQVTDQSQQEGFIVGLCTRRPWATNFLRYIVPPSFFDSLCALQGYTVGAPISQSQTQPQETTSDNGFMPSLPRSVHVPALTKASSTKFSSAASSSVPTANIWVVPSQVTVGTRVSVFWDAENVTSCAESSDDGTFSQASVSGQASTLPVSGPLKLTISCDAPDGSVLENTATVQLVN